MAGTGWGPEEALAVVPETEGACGAADRAARPVHVGRMSGEGVAALGMASAHLVDLAGAGDRDLAADRDVEPGPVDHRTELGSVAHSHLVPAVHKRPSAAHTACPPYPQRYGPAFPLDISGVQEGHSPEQGNQALAGPLGEALAVAAVSKDCLHHTVGLSFYS